MSHLATYNGAPAPAAVPPPPIPVHVAGADERENDEFAALIGPLVRRWRLLAAIFVGFMALVLIFTALAPRSYTTTVKMIAGAGPAQAGQSSETNLPVLNALLAASQAQSAETYTELLQEQPVAGDVIQDLNLNTTPNQLLQHIKVKPVTNTSIFTLAVSWPNADTSAKIANDFATVFVRRERDLIAGQAGSAIDFLSKQIPQAEADMRKADDALARYEASHNIADIANQTQTAIAGITGIDGKMAQTRVDMQQAQAQLGALQGQMGSTPSTINGQSSIVQNPVASQLQTQLAQTQVDLDAARKQYTDQHPTVIALKQKLAQLQREIGGMPSTVVAGNNFVPNPVYQQMSQQAATLRAQVAGDQAQLAQLDRERQQALPALQRLPAQTMILANLQRNAKLAEDVYTALRQKFNNATVAKTAALSDVAITQPADAKDAIVSPNWRLNLLLGLLIGLVLGVAGVYVADFFDNSFKEEGDVQRELPLALLSSVPAIKPRDLDALPWLRTLTMESFLQLVTSLRYSSAEPLRTIAITSAMHGDGKSTIAMNTALALAELQPSVLLIDADMRKPHMHKLIKLENQLGLSEVLVGAADWKRAVQRSARNGLHFLSAGRTPPNPIKLLQSNAFDEMLRQMKDEYTTIVIDTPALLPFFDGAIVGGKADGTVLVVSLGITEIRMAKRAVRTLSSVPGTNVLGMVLNRVTPVRQHHNYYLESSPLPPLAGDMRTEKSS